MQILVWTCIIVSLIGATCFLLSSVSVNQEAAGKSMARIAGVILLLLSIVGGICMFLNWPIIALVITIIPALIMCRILFRVISGV